ncbi:MAG: ATP-dependent DNA helicase RecG [Gammaproteobacteria bacterium]|nr:ATP-dependent DNA helicase RecG [Gammaproteobacteria bacterium]MBY0544652.1 ATP-dependent DNA helicase RecG [Gammaproteobacteria bacterium]
MQTSFSLLTSPSNTITGVTKRTAQCLTKLGLHTVQDILFHLPLRYQDRTHVTPMRNFIVGEEVVLQGTITNQQQLYKPRLQLIVQLTDGTGSCYIRFFYFNARQKAQLKIGERVTCYGEIRLGRHGYELIHPEYRITSENSLPPLENAYTPIYPSTEHLSQTTWRRITDHVLALLPHSSDALDLIPIAVRERYQLLSLGQALHYVHRPPTNANITQLKEGKHPAQQRLAFEELLAHQLSLRLFREQVQRQKAPIFNFDQVVVSQFLENLTFTLTAAQQRVLSEIAGDLERPYPMLRLVQGDVGSGKTVIAALAMLLAVQNGWQAALMAPTEILAEQHYQTFRAWMEPLGIRVGFLAGKLTGKARGAAIKGIQEGEYQIIIGTHALFQKDVNFAKLGLVVVDEQHRFGVEQRLALRNKGAEATMFPHQLIMTATPIPRTLAMTAYADLDVSVIDELPKGRKPVNTIAVSNQRRDEVIARIKEACERGCQVYWVCTLIDESEVLMCQAAESTAETLSAELGSAARVGLIHGRLTPTEKETIMRAFKQKELDLLVATTVIEVGVDVPNASLMIIENPERLGLSQLHQLRGRVGRGSVDSFCVMLYQSPLSSIAKERLAVMRETNDGFIIAERDLSLRGPGEMLGTRQTGEMQLKIANLERDNGLLPLVQQVAVILQQQSPLLIKPLIKRWLGEAEMYGQV